MTKGLFVTKPSLTTRVLQLAAAILVVASASATAAPVSFDFTIQATEGSAFGSFTGDDLNMDDSLSAGEILSFTATATGTAFTGGPFTIDASEAVVTSFTFDILGLNLSALRAGNGLQEFSVGAKWIGITGTNFIVGLNNAESTRVLSGINVVRQVPEPGSLALLAVGLVAGGLSRVARRRR